MKITLEKNELIKIDAIIDDDYYTEILSINPSVRALYGISEKQKEALDYVKSILPSFNEKQQDLLLEELRLTRSDVR